MRIVTIGRSGNAGKTTMTKHLLVPALAKASGAAVRRVSLDGVNAGDGETADQEVALRELKNLAAEINVLGDDEHIVIDIGASNAVQVLTLLAQFRTTTAAIDYWVLPCMPQKKMVLDTVATIRDLDELGVKTSRIVLVPNNVLDPESAEADFASLYKFQATGIAVSAPVLSNEIYEMLKGVQQSVFDIAAQPLDVKALRAEAAAAADPAAARKELGQRLVVHDMCSAAADQLQSVWDSTPIAAALAQTAPAAGKTSRKAS